MFTSLPMNGGKMTPYFSSLILSNYLPLWIYQSPINIVLIFLSSQALP